MKSFRFSLRRYPIRLARFSFESLQACVCERDPMLPGDDIVTNWNVMDLLNARNFLPNNLVTVKDTSELE